MTSREKDETGDKEMTNSITIDEQELNADAIYAGLCAARDFMKSRKGQEWYAAKMRAFDESPFVKWYSSAVQFDGDQSTITGIPRFDFSDEFIDEVYPGERLSVEAGVEMARMILFGPGVMIQLLMVGQDEIEGPLAIAMRRFFREGMN